MTKRKTEWSITVHEGGKSRILRKKFKSSKDAEKYALKMGYKSASIRGVSFREVRQ